MLIYLILPFLLGILAGTLTGLIPGIHVNLISLIIISSPLILLSPEFVIIFIITMAITHTFLDFIPSIYLGAPDEDTGLSILTGHNLLLKGKAYQAILLTLQGSISAIPVIIILTPIFLFILPKIQFYLLNIMFIILIIASIFLIITEKNSKILALLIFLLSGFLGLANSNLSINQPLLPLLTGLFGGSSLLTSIIKKQLIPPQKIPKIQIKKLFKKSLLNLRTFLASFISAPLCSFLPSLGSSQAAVIGSTILPQNKKQFLILLGAINTIVAGLAFITLYSINKTRTGAALAISQLSLQKPPINLTIIIIILSSIIATFLTIYISKLFAKNINKFNYKHLSILIFLFLIIIITYFSFFLGLLTFLTATFLGLFAISLNIRRTHLLGALMIPTILFYLPF